MSRASYRPPNMYTLPRQFTRHWSTTLSIWGIGAGLTVIYLLDVAPKVKDGLLVKIPLLGNYYEDKTPASDKPF